MKQPSDPLHDIPQGLTIFLDRNIASGMLVRSLRKAQITKDLGLTILSHIEEYKHNQTEKEITDAVWLKEAGQKEWIVLTQDLAIARNEVEKTMVIQAKVRLFPFSPKNMSTAEKVPIILKALPKLLRYAATHPGPYIVKLYKDASLGTPLDLGEV